MVGGDPVGLVRGLTAQDSGPDTRLCGGGRPAGAPLPGIGLPVSEASPVPAGAGVPLVEGGFDPGLFEVRDRQVFDNGVSVAEYARV